MTEKEMGKLLVTMSGFWPIKPDTATVILWHRAMGDISYDDAETALVYLMNTKNDGFPPLPVHFREVLIGMKTPELEMTGQEAWGELWKVVKRNSWTYGHEKAKAEINALGGRTVSSVNAIGGHSYLFKFDIDNDLPFVQRRFIEVYENISDRVVKNESLPPALQQKINGLMLKAGV